MPKVDIEILLRVPEGEELSDERLDVLEDMGFDETSITSRQKSQLIVKLRLAEPGWEREAESIAEDLVDAMPDADLQDIRLDD
jgi:hypothetical protein|tara:strand:+ start:1271 stop:1519 length:249 start_codon:yes stop_codon:yes gene_type:complete